MKTTLKLISLALLLTASLTTPVFANYKHGLTAYGAGRFQQAFQNFITSARDGDYKSQLFVADMYRAGKGVKADVAKAAYWYQKTAEAGSKASQFNLGFMHEKGNGVKQDYSLALKYYTMAAQQNDGEAQAKISLIHFNGNGVQISYIYAAQFMILGKGNGSENAARYFDILKDELSPLELATATVLAEDWNKKYK